VFRFHERSSAVIKAIETRYGGCHFRSRLEARWACVFDHLEIEWHYEPEGFETPHGRYLPDFYLPEGGAWIEVKGGSWYARDRSRAAHVADQKWVERGDKFRVLMGDIPRPGTRTVLMGHEIPGISVLSRVTGDATLRAHYARTGERDTSWKCFPDAPRMWERMPWISTDWTAERLDAAFAAARSERFGT
jgi:hypothetical protein